MNAKVKNQFEKRKCISKESPKTSERPHQLSTFAEIYITLPLPVENPVEDAAVKN